ncbi:MAG: hypothetical protein ACRDLQ_10685 [Solirubrobacterales bacterium]
MSGGPSSSSPGDPRRRIGARVRVSHLVQPGRRAELEGVVVGRQKYGVNVRLPDGTIRSFFDVEVSPVEPESSGDLRAGLLRAERDAISSGGVWDEAGVAAAELRIDRLKAQLGERTPGIHENHLRFN